MANITGLSADQIKKLYQSGGFASQPSTDFGDFYGKVTGQDPSQILRDSDPQHRTYNPGTSINTPPPALINNPVHSVPIDNTTGMPYPSDTISHVATVNADGSPVMDNHTGEWPWATARPNTPPAQSPTVDGVNPLDANRLGLGYGNGGGPTPPAVTAIDDATAPQPSNGGFFGGLLSGAGNLINKIPGVQTAENGIGTTLGNVKAAMPGVGDGLVKALAPAVMSTVAGRSAVIDPMLRQMVDNNRNSVAASMPDRGKHIMTANHGDQIIGTRLNGSPRGRTVTNDNWFNSVTGL